MFNTLEKGDEEAKDVQDEVVHGQGLVSSTGSVLLFRCLVMKLKRGQTGFTVVVTKW